MVDTSTIILDELDKMVLNMGHHVDEVLATKHSSSSSTCVYVKPKREIDYTLDNMTRKLETLSATLSSGQSPTCSMYEPGSRERGGGRSTRGRGKKERY